MKKEQLQYVDQLCKQAYTKGMLTQFMLKGSSKEDSKKLVKYAHAKIANMDKIATYRRNIIKAYLHDALSGK